MRCLAGGVRQVVANTASNNWPKQVHLLASSIACRASEPPTPATKKLFCSLQAYFCGDVFFLVEAKRNIQCNYVIFIRARVAFSAGNINGRNFPAVSRPSHNACQTGFQDSVSLAVVHIERQAFTYRKSFAAAGPFPSLVAEHRVPFLA